jgi:hypothetical protein
MNTQYGSYAHAGRTAGAVVLSLAATVWLFAFIFCYFGILYQNPYTPQGYAGYCTEGAFVGATKFVKVQYGPSSPGAGWLLGCTNVPMTPRTFEEDFSGAEALISGDKTKIEFAIDVIVRLRRGNVEGSTESWVQRFVEQQSTLVRGASGDDILKTAYEHNFKQRIKGSVRLAGDKHKGLDLQDNMKRIAQDVFNDTTQMMEGSSFELLQITIGYIHYPDRITNQVEQNLIAEQVRQQKHIQIDITSKQAEMNVIENEGLAEAARIINQSITPRWLQFQALQAELENMKSDNPTEIMIPVGPMGVPTVKSNSDKK